VAFARNYWYIAASSDEVGETPFARTILGEPVVLYRRSDGAPAALADRCCHRAAPLSLGRVDRDNLECGYHGLTFAPDGRCVRVPGQNAIPPGARVRAYPVVERWRTIWLFMGDPELADPERIPDYHWFDWPGWVTPTGRFHLKANYQRLIDNLLDFSHLQFVHRQTIGTDAIADIPSKIQREDGAIEINRWILDSRPPPLFAKAGGFSGNVDRWMNCRHTLPSSCVFDIGCAVAGSGAVHGDRSRGIEIRSLHAITPETDETTHYFWGYARNFALDQPGVTELLRKGAHATFCEDVEILEHQQRALAAGTRAADIDVSGDAAPLLARRMKDEILARESRE
jgi:phenylpropionate dioxygenase-like ring-hydroxylating dioxygenase large terminal subunit